MRERIEAPKHERSWRVTFCGEDETTFGASNIWAPNHPYALMMAANDLGLRGGKMAWEAIHHIIVEEERANGLLVNRRQYDKTAIIVTES